MLNKILTLLFSILLLTTPINIKSENKNFDWVEETLQKMTLREKIAQMIITSSKGVQMNEDSKEFKRIKSLIIKEKIGGIIFFKGNSKELASLTNQLQGYSEVPLLMSADYENGTGMRLVDGSLFPNNMAIGATRRSDLVYKMGLLIAKECKVLGIHQNYAPVVDVNNNPDNPIINVRSYGEKPELVSEMAVSFIKGLQDGNIIATAKHFPGHGDTDIDSHNDLPVLNFDIKRLEQIELLPFKNTINAGVKSVMVGHISLPEIDKEFNLPASLSPVLINSLLINGYGFKGLVVTDALDMAGITKNYSTKQVALLTVKAGVDLILMPQNEKETIDEIENAVLNGIISEDRIDSSVRKILSVKKWLNLDENKFINENEVSIYINSSEEQELSQAIADASITLVKNDSKAIPIIRKDNIFTLININNTLDRRASDLFIELMKNDSNFKLESVYDYPQENQDINSIIENIPISNFCIVPIFSKVVHKSGTVSLPKHQIEFIKKLQVRGTRVLVISFGNPYILRDFTDIDSYICAYSDVPTSVVAVYKALTGQIDFNGKLPITINDEFKYGYGLKIHN
ncbi:MAG: glycoside hydrolase family 3 protein [Ignavibacteria bacterium]|nr:glycoside hydrolase family 3 protein [Ignavibacteria bacterium]